MQQLQLSLSFVFAFLLASPVLADVPALINVQGRLVDGGGTLNGNVAVVVGLYSTFLGDDTISGSQERPVLVQMTCRRGMRHCHFNKQLGRA